MRFPDKPHRDPKNTRLGSFLSKFSLLVHMWVLFEVLSEPRVWSVEAVSDDAHKEASDQHHRHQGSITGTRQETSTCCEKLYMRRVLLPKNVCVCDKVGGSSLRQIPP